MVQTLFPCNKMCAEAFLLLHRQHGEAGLLSHGGKFRGFADSYIAVSEEICQRHLQMVHQPDHEIGGGILTQNETTPFSENTVSTVEKNLWVGVVMKAVRADDRVEGIFREGEILAVAHHKFGVGKLFGLSDVCLLYTSPSPRDHG